MKKLSEYINETEEKWWYGVKGARVIDHGEWADAEIEWDDELYNYWDVEEFVVSELGLTELYHTDDDAFVKEMNERPDDIAAALDEYASIYSENNNS